MLDYRQLHIQVLSPILEKYPQIRLGYVFGSYLCRQNFRDVDIAILLDTGADRSPFAAGALGCRIGEALSLGCDVDLKILNDSPIEFRYAIVRGGCLFYARNEKERVDFEIQVTDDYLDYREILNWFDAQGGASW
ncbi:MAG: nucleotidyltransferase domain-containing protein [Bacillota bacterium]|nr:nucleotidyltransferase domain-containing protein [Bacillota bacterium]MDW7683964.1 nucleotidyltransferase domain-containing protein [Bacillota bacterium]